MKILILLRHGQSTYNLTHRFTGWADAALTPLGQQQAAQAGLLLRQSGLKPQRAYSSCLLRAKQTLQAALAAAPWTDIPVQTDWRLDERHYGALQGLTREQAAQQFGLSNVLAWRRTFRPAPPPAPDNSAARLLVPAMVTPPNGESLQAAQTRALSFLNGVVFPAFSQADVQLLAAHEDLLRALAAHFKRLGESELENLVVPPAAPWVLELDDAFYARRDRFLGDPAKIRRFLAKKPE